MQTMCVIRCDSMAHAYAVAEAHGAPWSVGHDRDGWFVARAD